MTNVFVLDIETQNSFDDIGGRQNVKDLKISLVGVYSYQYDKFLVFKENELSELEELIKDADLIVGFNIKDFDFPVLKKYFSFVNLDRIPVIDLLEDIRYNLGFRVSLDNIAQSTLGISKSGDGLKAIEYFKAGDFDSLAKYCLDDVKITKEIYEHGKHNKCIYFTSNYSFEKYSIPVEW